MSTQLPPDAQELLEGRPRNERGQFAKTDPALAPTQLPPPPAPPAVDAAKPSLSPEQAHAFAEINRKKEEAEAIAEMLGAIRGQDGKWALPTPAAAPEPPTEFAPQPGRQPAVQLDPELQEIANALGLDEATAAKLQRVVDRRVVQTGGTLIDPLSRHGFAQTRLQYAQDPDFSVIEKTFDAEVERRVASLPAEYRAMGRVHPELLADALASARNKHFPELVKRATERATRVSSGRQVGAWTEGPAPTSEVPPAPELTSAQETWIQSSGIDLTPEQKANIAARRAARLAQGQR